jgi:hypothetical protein
MVSIHSITAEVMNVKFRINKDKKGFKVLGHDVIK